MSRFQLWYLISQFEFRTISKSNFKAVGLVSQQGDIGQSALLICLNSFLFYRVLFAKSGAQTRNKTQFHRQYSFDRVLIEYYK